MRPVSRAVLMALPFAGLGLLAIGPAAAQQSSLSQEFDDMRNAIGLGKDRPPIDFTERPPLVVPPSYTLPPPGSGDPDRLGVNDPDLAARRKALSDPRRPVPPTDPGASAQGRAARPYLIDPPSGMRDPDAVAADITHDSSPSGSQAKHTHAHKKKSSTTAQQQ